MEDFECIISNKTFGLKIANRINTFKLKYLTLFFFLLWIYYVYIYNKIIFINIYFMIYIWF